MRVILAITGASGIVYGVTLLTELLKRECEVYLIISEHAKKVIAHELDIDWRSLAERATRYYEEDDMAAPIASGSFPVDGMVIAPCSLKTLAAVANGFSHNLIARAAECTLKERRKLILVVRETPLSTISLWNMLKVSMAGGIILPASPAFYHKPNDVCDLVNYVVGKVLSCLGVEHDLFRPWSGFLRNG